MGQAPGLWRDRLALVRRLAASATIATPLVLAALILGLRSWTPRAYRVVRDGLFGKRLWLGFGLAMHLGIDLLMNVGTFVQAMICVYPVWLGGEDVDAMWRLVLWRAAKPGEAGRPAQPSAKLGRLARCLVAPFERAKYRVRRPAWVIVHGSAEVALRRVALLRCWDLGERLVFEAGQGHEGDALFLRSADGSITLDGPNAARVLISLFPGLWWLWPMRAVPGVDRLAMAILGQTART